MNYYIGIDLGTSSCKGLLVDRDGNIISSSSFDYKVYSPYPSYSEQNPSDYLLAAEKIIKELSKGRENDIKGLSFSGQMHGLVILDEKDEVIRPCILWNDSRTEKQTDYLNEVIGKPTLSSLTGNIAFAGFTAPKILWIKENEPENFKKIRKIMLPKDYLCYKLTGVFTTDYSDASGTLLLDVKNKCWSKRMCEICSIKEEQLPQLNESYQCIGKLLPKYGLPNCIVTPGAGDNSAAAIGNGTIEQGECNISLGTSGTIFISQDKFSVDKNNSLHSFAHANGKYHLMGCILTAASARKWFLEDILSSFDYTQDEKDIENVKSTDVIFLPYLAGERSPYNDTKARGAFINLSSSTSKGEMSLAIMEGVAFAIKNCLEVASSNGLEIKSSTICGGGSKSRIWKQIFADVLNIPIQSLKTEQGPSYGAAILAMIGNKEYSSFREAKKHLISIKETIYPRKRTDNLSLKYEKFKKLYTLLKQLY